MCIRDSLLIDGSGFIAATSLKEIMEQPLDLSLQLGAKGRLVDYLGTLQLLGQDQSDEGYQLWNQTIDIGGTLGKPDTIALKQLLNTAARTALSSPQSQAAVPSGETSEGAGTEPATQAPAKRSKEEQLLEDIQTGAELLNSFFGN